MIYAWLGLLSIIWGGSFYFIKVLLEAFGPWGVTFMRCICGAFILFLCLLITGKFKMRQVPWLALTGIGLINCAIPWTLIAFSEHFLTSSLTSVLNAATPLWTVILGVLFFGMASHRMAWAGVLSGLIGIVILVDIDWASFHVQHPIGIGAMVLSAICYGFGALLSKKHLQSVPPYLTAFMTLLVSGLFAGIWMMLTERPRWDLVLDISIWPSLIGLGVFGSGIAYLLYYSILQRGSAEFVTLVTYLVPPFAVMWGYLLLDEPLSWSLLVGMLFIFAGIFMTGRTKRVVNNFDGIHAHSDGQK